jgi:hypothetical protein
MKVPCLVWLQGPWSPLGYDVVERADEPAPEPPPAPTNDPLERREIPRVPWSPLGYQVVELAPPIIELASPGPASRSRSTKAARAVKGGRPRQRRRVGRRAALAAGGTCLATVALVLVMVAWPGHARPVPPAETPAQEAKLPAAPAVAPQDVWPADREGSERETFGTAVEFVRNAPEAGRIADRQHKLTFLLHVSGNFEDACFT